MRKAAFNAIAGDPFVLRDGGDYWMVDTNEGGWHAVDFDIWHSRDLVNWDGPYKIFRLRDTAWAKDMAWGPCLYQQDGLWYLCYAADQAIGIAVSRDPRGPYRDIPGRPLIEKGAYGIQTIEPCLVADGKDTYLVWGQGKCFIRRISLSPDGVRFTGGPVCLSDEFYYQRSRDPAVFDVSLYNESPDIVRFDGRWLMTWTCYDVRDVRYRVRYAWADDILGPYIQPLEDDYDNVLLRGSGHVQGTGGSCCFTDEKGELYIAYHRYVYPRQGYHREICVDRVEREGRDRLHVTV